MQALIVERTFAASAGRVWSALTDKAKMKQWYFDVDDFKPEVGFVFRFTGQNKGVVYNHICEVIEVIPEKKLVHTWAYDTFEGESTVTWELFAEGDDQTRVKLTHVGLETFPAAADFARENFEKGWTSILGKMLKEFLEK